MNEQHKGTFTMVVAVGIALLAGLLGYSLRKPMVVQVPVADKTVGGLNHNAQEDFSAGISVNGTEVISSVRGINAASTTINSGTSITKLVTGRCDLIGSPTIAVSSTAAMDCSAPGLIAGDVVFVTAPTTTPTTVQGWRIVAANASSTANYLTILLQNLTGASAMPGSSVTSGIQYFGLRL